MRESEATVLVVGAGPAGLTAALTLALGGMDPVVVDCRPGPGTETRAVWVQPRALELWAGLGVAGPIVDGGREVHALRVHGTGPQARSLELDVASDWRPHLVPQPHTERALLDALQGVGAPVRWGTRFVRFREPVAGQPAAELELGDGTRTVLRASHVVGADGAHSTVRRTLGLRLTGRTHRQSLFVADVAGELSLGVESGHLLLTDTGACAVLPLPGQRWRVAGTTGPEGTAPRLPELLRPWGAVTAMDEPSIHRAHARWLTGRPPRGVTLIGDAAHLHSPVGGQGLNLAVADGHAIAWCLVARHRGAAASLTAARDERAAVSAGVRRTTELLFGLQTTAGPVASCARRAVFAALTSSLFGRSPLAGVPARVLGQIGHVPAGGLVRTAAAALGAPAWLSGARVRLSLARRDATRHLLVGVTPDVRRPAPSSQRLRTLVAHDPVLQRQVEVVGDLVSPSLATSLGASEPVVGLLRPDDVLMARGRDDVPALVVEALSCIAGGGPVVSGRPRRWT